MLGSISEQILSQSEIVYISDREECPGRMFLQVCRHVFLRKLVGEV